MEKLSSRALAGKSGSVFRSTWPGIRGTPEHPRLISNQFNQNSLSLNYTASLDLTAFLPPRILTQTAQENLATPIRAMT